MAAVDASSSPPQVRALVVRPVATNCGRYSVESGGVLGMWTENLATLDSTTPINAEYERAVYTAPFNGSGEEGFGRVRLRYAP
jgi:hypothetical protein